MKVLYFDLQAPISIQESLSACIGYFDGVHLGHQKLIEKVLEDAVIHGSVPALITFEPDPWTVIKHMDAIPHITPMKQRMAIGEKLGIQVWIILKFQEEMANLSVEDFHTRVLKPMHLHTLVCGYDFHYAHKGSGNVETLKTQQDFQVNVVEEVSSEHQKISSSRIEELLSLGDVTHAAVLLGRFYSMQGHVKQGRHVGGEHGFPTANLQLDEDYIIPKKGVYIGCVKVQDAWHPAILNVGNNPTYNYQQNTSIEAHLLNFHENIYGEPVTFRFLVYHREEQKFANVEALSAQLRWDSEQALLYFNHREELYLCD